MPRRQTRAKVLTLVPPTDAYTGEGRKRHCLVLLARTVPRAPIRRAAISPSRPDGVCIGVRRGDARRAKLYYLRDRIGKSRRLRDQRRGLQHVETWEAGHADRVAASKAGHDSAEAAPPTGDE